MPYLRRAITIMVQLLIRKKRELLKPKAKLFTGLHKKNPTWILVGFYKNPHSILSKSKKSREVQQTFQSVTPVNLRCCVEIDKTFLGLDICTSFLLVKQKHRTLVKQMMTPVTTPAANAAYPNNANFYLFVCYFTKYFSGRPVLVR